MRPRCYNRPPFQGQAVKDGLQVNQDGTAVFRIKFQPFTMSQDCGSWKGFAGGQEVEPIRMGWDCDGCRWKPEDSK